MSVSVATGSRDARVHTQPSNRANAGLGKGKSKASDERRVVYKPVLENPHQIKWPSTPLNVQNGVLACLGDLLPAVADYHIARETPSRKRKSSARAARHQAKLKGDPETQKQAPAAKSKKRPREENDASEAKRTKLSHGSKQEKSRATPQPLENSGLGTSENPSHPSTPLDDALPSEAIVQPGSTTQETPSTVESELAGTDNPAPPILKHCTFGINQVAKRLEAQANPTTAEAHPPPRPSLRVVIACRADVDPPLLIAHFPILVAACNSALPAGSSDDTYVKLVTLPMGAEHSLAEITGLRRVAVMALDAETPGLERLESLLSSVPALRAAWLAPPSGTTPEEPLRIVPTHVKQLKTTAPKDMKAAREKRKRELGEAKEAAKEDGGRRKRRKVKSSEKSDIKA
ncbi:hypothetical protein BDV93DRAFT_247746 [Ceratobasidium sp. AG-I]|nr:hypothetical protein BDV93DRAFT_247746 [Ceratobasidium sp. AG-I]